MMQQMLPPEQMMQQMMMQQMMLMMQQMIQEGVLSAEDLSALRSYMQKGDWRSMQSLMQRVSKESVRAGMELGFIASPEEVKSFIEQGLLEVDVEEAAPPAAEAVGGGSRRVLTEEKEFKIKFTNNADKAISLQPDIEEEIPLKLPNEEKVVADVKEEVAKPSVPKQITQVKPPYVVQDVAVDFVNEEDKEISVKPEVTFGKEITLENEDKVKAILREQLLGEGLPKAEVEKRANEQLEAIKLVEDKNVKFLSRSKMGRIPLLGYLVTGRGIKPSGEHTLGRKLKIQLVDPTARVIPPGSTFEQFQVQNGLALSAEEEPVKIYLTYDGETVEQEKIIETKAEIGGVIDVEPERNLLDIYMIIPKVEGSYGIGKYQMELNINKAGDTQFSEIYGTWPVKQEEGLLVAQELEYDPN
jgi:hypothetical protein